jgi:hypothetical protein
MPLLLGTEKQKNKLAVDEIPCLARDFVMKKLLSAGGSTPSCSSELLPAELPTAFFHAPG